jgi:hypothetical protein
MKKFISTLTFLTLLILILFIVILSTIGIETKRFNNIFSKKINETNNNINLELTTIKFKFDIKKISLFFETNNSQVNYRTTLIPVKNIKVYMDFKSFINSDSKIKKIIFVLNQLDIEQLKKISITFKPSNFKSFINKNIKEGKLSTEIEVYFSNNNTIDNFIARGTVSDLKTEIVNGVKFEKTKFSFFADKSDILLKNIFSDSGPLKIEEGDLKVKLNPIISLDMNFKTKVKFNNKFKKYANLIKDFEYGKNITNLEADLYNNLKIDFDQTYKVKKFDYRNNGSISRAILNFEKPIKNYFSNEEIKELTLVNSEFKTAFSSQNNKIILSGKYSLNNDSPLSFELENVNEKGLLKLRINGEYNRPVILELINYKKSKDSILDFTLNLEKRKNELKIKNINLSELNNSIIIKDLKFKKNKFLSLNSISVKTEKNGKINNDFSVSYKKKIKIKGNHFDASNLPKLLNKKNSLNEFSHINKDIEIDFINITAPLSENLNNFKLIGKIEKGKFTKITSKGDFGENNFLDITLKKDQNNEKKYLEIYSDLTKPLLTEYSFFKGLTGGKLLYTSIVDGDNSNSKLKIENFKVINAAGIVKLLSLADLSGLADLAEGEGLSFDILEIDMERNKDQLKLNEILALGPSISVLMEGYQNPTVTSLRGTLVPAKSLNKMISKIPILGNIVIPKEVGEGLFGISFKMKGPPGKIKTTINPLRSITPRFIQKIIERNKNSK